MRAGRMASTREPSIATDPGRHVAKVRVRGTDATVEVEFDIDELCRREFRTAPATKLDTYNILLSMPVGVPCTESLFSAYEWRALTQAAWAVSIVAGQNGEMAATRLARPPVTVRRANILGGSWAAALGKAARFAPYCERRIVLPRLPEGDTLLKLEASYLGVGVAIPASSLDDSSSSTPLEEVVPAAPFLPSKFTGAAWKFAESVFDQIQMGDAPAPGAGAGD